MLNQIRKTVYKVKKSIYSIDEKWTKFCLSIVLKNKKDKHRNTIFPTNRISVTR